MAPSKTKKRKSPLEAHDIETSKPTAIFRPSAGRKFTLSVAVPGSVIANAQSHDLKTALAGQIARALAVFCVDEVVVFNDNQSSAGRQPGRSHREHEAPSGNGNFQGSSDSGYTGFADPDNFLAHLLSYLETPPHLRKHLFPLHPDLRTAGTLPSLDMPHHLRNFEWCRYREGVCLGPPSAAGTAPREAQKAKKQKTNKPDATEAQGGSLIEVGLQSPVKVQDAIPEHARVTVKFADSDAPADFQAGGQSVSAVDPSAPREDAGYYWGFQVRPAGSLSAVITECPFDGGYDLTWGTSERGRPVSDVVRDDMATIPPFRHMLVVFGGVAGLEMATKADPELAGMGVVKPEDLFDYWINLCPGQGSRTIRTEEAVWLGLMGLREIVNSKGLP